MAVEKSIEKIVSRFFILPRKFYPTNLYLLLITDRRMILLSKARAFIKKQSSHPLMTKNVFNSEELNEIIKTREKSYQIGYEELLEIEVNTSPFKEETFGYFLKIATKKKETKWDLRLEDLENFRKTMQKLKVKYVEK
ncbi:MAG: hypothetical protein WED07_15110 [Candidatus Freyarchaeum deiterrae]